MGTEREGRETSKEEDRKKRKAAVNGGEGRGGRDGDGQGEGKEGGGSAYAVRNADPFPRWPLWTISLPFLLLAQRTTTYPVCLLSPPCSLLLWL